MMKAHFSIHYVTRWGEKLRVVGSAPELGAWDASKAPDMACSPSGVWTLDVAFASEPADGALTYKYGVVREPGATVEWEAGPNRSCDWRTGPQIELSDAWRDPSDPEIPLATAPFAGVILRPPPAAAPAARRATPGVDPGAIHRFRIATRRVPAGLRLCISGSDPALGAWDEAHALPMDGSRQPYWTADVTLANRNAVLEYKYALYDPETRRIAAWEQGANRTLWIGGTQRHRLVVRTDEQFRHPEGPWRGAGVAIPVFSLRTRNGLGVGEFLDIKLLVDWARKVGVRMIQLLPVNDTVATHTWVDSYPYAAISVFALHPLYLNLQAIGTLSAGVTQAIIAEQRSILNRRGSVDYEAVMAVKSRFYKLIYDETSSRFLADPEFLAFFEANRSWLRPYAAYSYLRDLYGTPDYTRWEEYRTLTPEKLDRLTARDTPHFHDIGVHYFIQFHLHKQLLEAAQYARQNGVILKGDIPIGVYRHSIDTWVAPELFNMDRQAGAPPDDFSAAGQNWRFPTYNWEAMARDGYAWWQARLRKLSAYFDAFRIDHILGFFRIWEVPLDHVEGIMGQFNPALPFGVDELGARGMWFNRERLCEPYIRRHMLPSRFGEFTDEVAREYLDEPQPGCYRLKPAFRTQRQVEDHLASTPDAPMWLRMRNEKIKRGLFDLISDVLLLEAPGTGGAAFNPRHSFHRTHAYSELDDHTKRVLDGLYIDYFYRRHETFWREQAMVKLPAIKNATNMLICGEDLGMVPDCVAGVMQELGILSLFIQRMPKDPKLTFHHPGHCPYLAVCTPSSHDMSTVRGWWEEDRARTQSFYNQILGHRGPAPFFCEPWICREIIDQHLHSPAMWAVFPIQDMLSISEKLRRQDPREEQINVPSNPTHYWKYRLHINLEDLLAEDEFNAMLRGMVAKSGRDAG